MNNSNNDKKVASMSENMVSINVVPNASGEVVVNVHHYHHFPDQSSQSKVKATTTTKSAPSEVSSSSVLPNGATVRFLASASALNKDGSSGSYLGVESGAVVADLPRDSPRTLFQVVLKNGHTFLRSVGGKCLRVTAKAEVDALGGAGNWARFTVEPMAGSAVSLKSAAPQHASKMNANGSEGLYIGVLNGAVVGNSGPFSFAYELVESAAVAAPSAPVSKEQRKAAREKERQERQASRQEMTKEERMAAKAARQAAKKQDQLKKQELLSGWTEVKAVKTNPKVKAKSMPVEAVPTPVEPKATKEPKVVTKEPKKNAFPTGLIHLLPLHFIDLPNRKKTMGWHIGISPQGFLVPDASSGNWGTLTALAVGEERIVLEASHTPAFHLAIDKNRLLTHRGGKGKFAQFVPERHGQFYSLRCVAHEEPAYLAVSPSGVLYTAKAPSKDTRFKVSSPVTTA